MLPQRSFRTALFSAVFISCAMHFSSAMTLAAPDPAIQAIVNQISQASYESYFSSVENMGLGLYGGQDYNQGYRGRDGWNGGNTLGNQEMQLFLQDEFTRFGLNVSKVGDYENIIGELPGTVSPEKIYVLSGHFDHVASGTDAAERPGGDDNASGISGVLAAAQILSQYEFESTIRFIGFNAEEDGLKGSREYISEVVVPAGEEIIGVINLDMILMPGWANPSGDSEGGRIDLDLVGYYSSDPATAALINDYATIATDYVPNLTVVANQGNVGGSDNKAFAEAGFPALLAIENTPEEIWTGDANPYYHTYDDASDHAAGAMYDYAFATDVARSSAAYICTAAGIIISPEPTTNGDLNDDGVVDDDDLALLLSDTDDPATPLDQANLAALLANFGRTDLKDAQDVPEPTALTLGLFALLALAWRPRQQ